MGMANILGRTADVLRALMRPIGGRAMESIPG